jgi:hypothetical protein
MTTQKSTRKIESVVEKVTAIGRSLESEREGIKKEYENAIQSMKEGGREKFTPIYYTKAGEIAKALSEDVSKTGRSMKEMLLKMGKEGSFEARVGNTYPGLRELRMLHLINYATQDKDDIVLTDLGRAVCAAFGLEKFVRKDKVDYEYTIGYYPD